MRFLRCCVAGTLVNAGVLAAIAGLAAPAPHASAQVRFGGPGGLGGSEISKRSLEPYGRILKLDQAQKDAMAQLQEAYADAARRADKEMEEAMKPLQEEASDGDFSVFGEKMPKIMEEAGKKRGAARASFLSDLKQLLRPDQEAAWPALERYRRREGHLRAGMVSGSGVDLTTVVESMKLPEGEAQKLRDTLDQYEQDMDRMLVEREKADEKKPDDFKFDPANFDMQKIKARMDEEREKSVKLRDLNRQYERRLAPLFDDAARVKFQDEVKKRSFRRIYSEPHVSTMLNAAAKFDDLDAAQKSQLGEMKSQYEKDLKELNDKWAAALEQAETEGKAGGPFGMFGGGGKSEELKAAEKARKDLDKKFTDRITTALNEKQRDRLPKKKSDNFMRFGGGDDGDGPEGAMVFRSVEDDGEGAVSDVHVIVAPGGK